MDRTGKVVRFDPKDLRVINGKKVSPHLGALRGYRAASRILDAEGLGSDLCLR